MELTRVSSANLGSVGYDPDNKLLLIQFNSGAAYEYYGVPESVYNDLMNAGSKGKFFSLFIKNLYPYKKTTIDGK